MEKQNENVVETSCGFTKEQEDAIWSIIQYLSKEQHKNPKKIWKRNDVFNLIKDELNFGN